MSETPSENVVALTTELVSAFAGSNAVPASDLPTLIRDIHATLNALSREEPEDTEPVYKPAVSVRKSIASRDHIISLIDGKPYRALKRHLAAHGLTPADYRARFKLPGDYPMIALGYSEERSAAAKARGLGRKPAPQPPAKAPKAAAKPKAGRAGTSAKTTAANKSAASRKSPPKGGRSRTKS
ncbi:transcriptional regulator [Glycocaulis profundi]|nr:transcriptional regulator [Glycocaulis profundi]